MCRKGGDLEIHCSTGFKIRNCCKNISLADLISASIKVIADRSLSSDTWDLEISN